MNCRTAELLNCAIFGSLSDVRSLSGIKGLWELQL